VGPRRRSVNWTEAARQQLDEALAYVAEDSPDAAARMLEHILDIANSLSMLSERGRMVPEMADRTIREIQAAPFRLLYEVHESGVFVLGMIHQRRSFQTWVEREFKRRDIR